MFLRKQNIEPCSVDAKKKECHFPSLPSSIRGPRRGPGDAATSLRSAKRRLEKQQAVVRPLVLSLPDRGQCEGGEGLSALLKATFPRNQAGHWTGANDMCACLYLPRRLLSRHSLKDWVPPLGVGKHHILQVERLRLDTSKIEVR